jgi:hypothetical protein
MLFTGMLVLAWCDLYAVQMLIAEREEWYAAEPGRQESPVAVIRVVPDRDTGSDGGDLVAGNP